MKRRPDAALPCLLILLLVWGVVHGSEAAQEKTTEAPSTAQAASLPDYTDAATQHTIRLGDRSLSYTATAGALTIPVEADKPQGTIFYVAYVRRDVDTAGRPITFVFNGGPGAAAVYLHLGAIGPRRVVFNDDGTLPPAPASMAENPFTWLAFTDVVFVDPIGTGYSRSAAESRGKDDKKPFWGIEEDLGSLGAFIRLYLTRNNRWQSPKFLVGESYGGFRVAALARKLPTTWHIRLTGLVLVSPALEFSLHTTDNYRLLPWVLRIPAYAAVARYHGKSSLPNLPAQDVRAALAPVETFSLGALLTGLAQGATLDEGAAGLLYERLAGYIGLPGELVRRYRGKVPLQVFAKALLRDSQRVLSLYDGSLSSIDPNPASPVLQGQDPRLDTLSAAFTAAFNSYVREELQFHTDVPYRSLNPSVHRAWNWRSGVQAPQGFAGTADALKTALTHHTHLQALIAHGSYDLVTPYFDSVFVVAQMALDPAVRPRLHLEVYEGGHMFYSHTAALKRLSRHVRAFYHSLVPALPGSP
jgi:carboxypeptidase C (cathepsin A)